MAAHAEEGSATKLAASSSWFQAGAEARPAEVNQVPRQKARIGWVFLFAFERISTTLCFL